MRFVLPFSGSRGDVQPGLTLALELAERGHDVHFGAPPNLMAFAESIIAAGIGAHGSIEVSSFGPDTQELLTSELIRVRLKSKNPRVRLSALGELANHGWDLMTEQLHAVSAGADAIVTGSLGQEMGLNVAQARSSAFVALHYCPLRRSGAVPVAPWLRTPAPVNRTLWSLAESMRWRSMARRENEQRRTLSLAPTTTPMPARSRAYGGVEIQAYDGLLFPVLQREWTYARPFAGFLDPPGSTQPLDEELRRWIESGPAPVYFGFGSMPVAEPRTVVSMITASCARLGVRALICGGWSELEQFSAQNRSDSPVRTVSSVDHRAVLPLCRAAVHHGGAGTTAAGLRAGIPTMVCWFSADQPFWGAALERVGAGVSVRFRGLTPEVLERGLTTLLTDRCAEAAERTGRSMTPASTARANAASWTELAARRKRGRAVASPRP